MLMQIVANLQENILNYKLASYFQETYYWNTSAERTGKHLLHTKSLVSQRGLYDLILI